MQQRLAEVLLDEDEGEGAKPHEARGEAEEQQPCLVVLLPLDPRCPPARERRELMAGWWLGNMARPQPNFCEQFPYSDENHEK